MSTNATITIEQGGKFVTNYVHYDGYLSHLGKVLVDHFDTIDKASELVFGVNIRAIEGDGSIERFIETLDESPFSTYDDYDDLLEHYGQEFNYLLTDAGSEDGSFRWVYDNGEVEDDLITRGER